MTESAILKKNPANLGVGIQRNCKIIFDKTRYLKMYVYRP